MVCNKIDIVPLDELSDENKEALSVFEKEGIPVFSMSTMTDVGIMEVKEKVIILNWSLLYFFVLQVLKCDFVILRTRYVKYNFPLSETSYGNKRTSNKF